jgi:hypothetical protein
MTTSAVACSNKPARRIRVESDWAGRASASGEKGQPVPRLPARPPVAARLCDLAERGRTVSPTAMHNPTVTQSALIVIHAPDQLCRPRWFQPRAVDRPRPEELGRRGLRPARTGAAKATGIPEKPTITSPATATTGDGGIDR